jgi:hypothetical protein
MWPIAIGSFTKKINDFLLVMTQTIGYNIRFTVLYLRLACYIGLNNTETAGWLNSIFKFISEYGAAITQRKL